MSAKTALAQAPARSAVVFQNVRVFDRKSDSLTGAMRDYENKFWLPFKGVRKPVYAIRLMSSTSLPCSL